MEEHTIPTPSRASRIRTAIYRAVLGRNRQMHLELPYVTYWGCDEYHWLRIHKASWVSVLTGNRVNGTTWFTIRLINGTLSISGE